VADQFEGGGPSLAAVLAAVATGAARPSGLVALGVGYLVALGRSGSWHRAALWHGLRLRSVGRRGDSTVKW
jgi:hypothetical protein